MERADLHDAIQAYANADPGVPGEGLLTRWLLIEEFALPDGGRALRRITGTHDGSRLYPWEARGFLVDCLLNEPTPQLPDTQDPLFPPDEPDDPEDPDGPHAPF